MGEFTYLYRYDINKKDKFEKLFGDLYIGKNPTEERNSFLIWKISFAGVDAGNGEEGLRKSFNEKVILSVEKFVSYYSDLLQDKVVSKDIKSAGILHGEGFVKVFYKALKDATTDNFGRIFMTGVSPIMLDDLTSGFNITRNYTLDENLNAMLGFFSLICRNLKGHLKNDNTNKLNHIYLMRLKGSVGLYEKETIRVSSRKT